MAIDAALAGVFGLPFEEQITFFRRKLNLPTERWDDIRQAAHDRAFVVAGAMKADLLQDLRGAVDKVVGGGTTLEAFRKDFREIVKRHGWTGWTGEGSKAGEAWRTRVIYETNLRTSYAAGRWRQLTDPDMLEHLPFWRYVHNDSVLHPRPHHKRWGDLRLTLRYDHPFWKTHFPPNGWGCRCRVVAVAGPEDGDATEPPAGWNARDSAGRLPGIDKGWAYAPGASTDVALRQMVQDKLISYPPAIARALSHDVNQYINATDKVAEFVTAAAADSRRREPLWLGFVEDTSRFAGLTQQDLTGYLLLLPADAVRHVERAHGFDGGAQRAPIPQDYRTALQWLAEGKLTAAEPGSLGHARIKATWHNNGEELVSIWEVRPGRRNRALALVSLWIKVEQ